RPGPMLTLEGGNGRRPGVELRPACVLGVPSSGRKPPGDDPDPRDGRRSPLSPTQNAETPCLRATRAVSRPRNGDGPRPSAKCRGRMPSTPVLWQFRMSHFNEKARWALDWKGIPHVRRSLLPALHVPRILWMTGQKSVPVLVLDGKAIADSTRIIEALERLRPDPALYPTDDAARRRALALEEYFDTELGPHIRRALFHALLPDSDLSVALLTLGFG